MQLCRLGDAYKQKHNWVRSSKSFIRFRFAGFGKGMERGSEFDVQVDIQDILVAIAEMELAGSEDATRIASLLEQNPQFSTVRQTVQQEYAALIAPEKLSISTIAKIFENLGERRRVTRTMWARRSQEYEAKIKSGDLMVVASVVHDLYPRSKKADSIYTEWKIYEAALEALVACVASINKCSENETRRLIKKYLKENNS